MNYGFMCSVHAIIDYNQSCLVITHTELSCLLRNYLVTLMFASKNIGILE